MRHSRCELPYEYGQESRLARMTRRLYQVGGAVDSIRRGVDQVGPGVCQLADDL